MRENNYTRVFNHYYTGKGYYKKTDALRYDLDNMCIKDHGTAIAYITSNDDGLDFLVVDAHRYKNDQSGNRHKQELVKAAQNENIYVIFVPYIDLGFGIPERAIDCSYAYELLIGMRPVEKYGTDDAACLYGENQVIGFTFAQGGYTAVGVLLEYMKAISDDVNGFRCSVASLQELCYSDLEDLIYNEVRYIFYHNSNDKTRMSDGTSREDLDDLLDNIQSKTITIRKCRVHYLKILNNKVDKYFDKLKERK